MIKDFWTEDEIEMTAEEYDMMKGQIVTMRLK